MAENLLYYGDNLDWLREIGSGTVDLVYLDPPFNSTRSYNVLFQAPSGADSAAQIQAFGDTWHWSPQTAEHLSQLINGGAPSAVADALTAMRHLLGTNDMLAYLVMMAPRLVELHRVLKITGSIYLHCDPTASHYLKILMDGIFGARYFRNEIIWKRADPKGHAYTRFPSTHDVIFYYVKGEHPTWHTPHCAYSENYLRSHYSKIEEVTGRHYTLSDCTNPNRDRPNLTYEWHGVTKVWRWTKEKMKQMDAAGRLIYTSSGAPRYKRYLDEMPGNVVRPYGMIFHLSTRKHRND